jgi:hypothetical protein
MASLSLWTLALIAAGIVTALDCIPSETADNLKRLVFWMELSIGAKFLEKRNGRQFTGFCALTHILILAVVSPRFGQ